MDINDKCVFIDNEQALHNLVKAKDRLIVLVYVSWCPFCREFLPVFQKYARENRWNFARVQDDREIIGDKYFVDIFPTVLFFEKGKVAKRLDGEPGAGLSEKQLADFLNETQVL